MDIIVRELLEKHHLLNYKDEILNASTPCIKLVPKACDEKILTLGTSKLGGYADLPNHIIHPEYKGEQLTFIAQINCEQIAKYDQENFLPKKGILYFFYDEETQAAGIELTDKSYWKVIYYPGESNHLVRENLYEETKVFNTAQIIPVNATSFADIESSFFIDKDWSDDSKDSYLDLIEEYWDKIHLKHQILGFPKTIQLEVFTEVLPFIQEEKKDSNISVEDLILLLQVETDENDTNMLWGDEGKLYFVITKEDLKNENFENVWVSLQSN